MTQPSQDSAPSLPPTSPDPLPQIDALVLDLKGATGLPADAVDYLTRAAHNLGLVKLAVDVATFLSTHPPFLEMISARAKLVADLDALNVVLNARMVDSRVEFSPAEAQFIDSTEKAITHLDNAMDAMRIAGRTDAVIPKVEPAKREYKITTTLPERPRRDPPPGLRMVFDITPEWWGAGILGRDLFFGAQAAISIAIATTIPAELPDLIPFLGTVREIRFSVQRVELECIDMRRTTNEKGPDFTIGGDRTMLVFALNKLRSKEQIAKEDVVLTAIHAKEARGNDLFARLEVEGQKQAEAEAKEALPIELKPNEIPIEEPGPSIGARLRRLVDTIEDARAEVARDVHAGYIDSVPQFAEYLLAEIEGSFGGLIGPRRAQSATIADLNRTRSRS